MAKYQKIELSVVFYKEGKKFIAYSPGLDISTWANSFEKAKKRFEELVDIFFEELEEMGTLKDVLKECGWQEIKKGDWIPPKIIARTEETFRIPCTA